MTETLNYDLNINHLENGHTKLTTPLYWAEYDEDGKIINAGVNGHTEFPIPLPVCISVQGRPKRKVGKDGIKSILRDGNPDKERISVQFVETEGKMSEEHHELFDRLREVLDNHAPEEGRYLLNLRFFPHSECTGEQSHQDKIDELMKNGFREVSPSERGYFLNDGFYPFDKEPKSQHQASVESELIEPSDSELAMLLAILNHYTQN